MMRSRFYTSVAVVQYSGLGLEGTGNPVNDKSRGIFSAGRVFADRAYQVGLFLNCLRGRAVALDDLHQRHQRRRIEEMQT